MRSAAYRKRRRTITFSSVPGVQKAAQNSGKSLSSSINAKRQVLPFGLVGGETRGGAMNAGRPSSLAGLAVSGLRKAGAPKLGIAGGCLAGCREHQRSQKPRALYAIFMRAKSMTKSMI